MPRLELHVTYVVNGTVQPQHTFTCDKASRTIKGDGSVLAFTNGFHVDVQRPIAAAQYRTCEVILSYFAEEQS